MKASNPVGRRPLAVIGRLAAAATAACLAGCFSYPVNPPLSHYDLDTGYRFRNLGTAAEQAEQDKTFIVLTFSGGGTRAAAFAYGALEALEETKLADDRTLLDEVDVISSVSGGSFASAYLGLFGKQKFFAEFPDAVLNRQIESALIGDVFKPWNWPKLMSPNYGRSDMADAYYDADIFEGRRFADLPLHRPFIVLNATDIGRGAQFSFTQDSFDRICSDLGPVTVSRGVTASSAFPVAFTPLTIKNYGVRRCRYETRSGSRTRSAPARTARRRCTPWRSSGAPTKTPAGGRLSTSVTVVSPTTSDCGRSRRSGAGTRRRQIRSACCRA